MAGFLDAVKSGVKSAFCGALSDGQNIAGLFQVGIGVGIIGEVLSLAYGGVCDGSPVNPPGFVPEPPFSGGQCVGVAYGVRISINYNDIGPIEVTYGNGGEIVGPIVSIGVDPANGNVTIVHNGGASTLFSGGRQQPNSGFSIVSLFTPFGGANNCGDPPAGPPQSVDEIDREIDINYDDDSGNPVSLPNLPIKFFKPCVNLDGVRVPFELETPFGKICGKIGIAGDIPNIIEPSIDIDLCPSQKEDLQLNEPDIETFFELESPVGPSVSSDFDGVLNEGSSPPENPIMGIFVNSRNKDNKYSQSIILSPSTNSPDILIPRIGYVQFQYLVQTSETEYETAFSEDIPIKFSQQFIPCPFVHGAISVSVNWDKKWEGNYRIARRKSCCDACKNVDPSNPPLDKLDRCRLD